MLFKGTQQNSVDPKGRVSIPVKYREALGETFCIVKGFDKCIDVYTMEEWEKFAKKLERLSSTKKDTRIFVRYIFGSAVDVEIDRQGRILLSQQLRKDAGIEKEVMVLGVGNKIEIWDKATWEVENLKSAEAIESIAESMGAFDVDFDFE